MNTFSVQRVSRRHPCEICGRHDWCTYTDSVAFCMRVSRGSLKTARNGSYMHAIGGNSATPLGRPSTVLVSPSASQESLHRIYTAFLSSLSLSMRHLDDMRRRGLDTKSIEENLYASAPTAEQGKAIAAELEPIGLEGIPGFYKVGDHWRLVMIPSGILIPIRNEIGQICGIQIRRDESSNGGKYIWLSSRNLNQGTSSGAPTHWASPGLLDGAGKVLLTEGALKADLISFFVSAPVIAAAGVHLFGQNFGTRLKANYGNMTAIICFDSDWRLNPQVKRALIALQRQLSLAGVRWKVRCWPVEYKGYDDYLLAARSAEVAA